MSSDIAVTPPGGTAQEAPQSGQAQGGFNLGRFALGVVGMIVTGWLLWNAFLAFGYYPEKFGNKITLGIIAVIVGIAGSAIFFWFLNLAVEGLPGPASLAIMPYAY